MRAPTARGRRPARRPPRGRASPVTAALGRPARGLPRPRRADGGTVGEPWWPGGAERSGAQPARPQAAPRQPGEAGQGGRTAARGPGWPPMVHPRGGRRGCCGGAAGVTPPPLGAVVARRVRPIATTVTPRGWPPFSRVPQELRSTGTGAAAALRSSPCRARPSPTPSAPDRRPGGGCGRVRRPQAPPPLGAPGRRRAQP